MERNGREALRARSLAACALLLGALCGCATGNRTGGIAFSSKNPAQLSEVVPGKLYRSAQPTAHGLEEAMTNYGIRTVINLRGEDPDPDLGNGQGEREFCEAHGLHYLHIGVHQERDDLFPTKQHPERPLPPFVEEFLATMDDANNWPVVIHCAGGKHRTGLLIASYRIAKQGWSAAEASAEMMSYGYGKSDFRQNPHILPYLQYLAARSAPDATRSAALQGARSK